VRIKDPVMLAGLVSLAFFLPLVGAAVAADGALSEALDRVVPVVVVDPGHGGKDKGVVSADGVEEKDVSRDLAVQIQDECRRRGKIKVVLTRSTDKNLEALARTGLANGEKANAFVSLHFNASFSPFASGVQVYYCRGDESLIGESGFRPWQGVAASHRLESQRLSVSLAAALGSGDDAVKELAAPFLQGIDMPAAMVEVAFLSNELELAIVNEESEAIALRIVEALESFFAGKTGEE
jgi:N-acetylmuramoyl-L-alanine amidase